MQDPLGQGDRAALVRSRSLLVAITRLQSQAAAVLAQVKVSVYAPMPVESAVVRDRRLRVNRELEDALLLAAEMRAALRIVSEGLGLLVDQ